MNIKIDPEFRDLIPPLSEVELDQLHSSLSASGCISPLIVWRDHDILIDGHNRFTYCEENGIDFTVRQMRFTSREVAKNWIILNQLGRRNVSPDVAARLRGMLYLGRKRSVTNPEGTNQHSEEVEGNSCPQPKETTAEVVAKETGVSPRTIKNDATYAEACDKLGITTAAIASGEENRSRKEIIATAFPEKAKPKAKQKKAPEPEPIIEDEDDVECLVVDGTGERSKEEQWEILFDYFKMLPTEQQQLLYTEIKKHLEK
jgi:hypothetical protein